MLGLPLVLSASIFTASVVDFIAYGIGAVLASADGFSSAYCVCSQ